MEVEVKTFSVCFVMRKSELRVIPSTLIVSTHSTPCMTIGIDDSLKPRFAKIISRVLHEFNFRLVFAQDATCSYSSAAVPILDDPTK